MKTSAIIRIVVYSVLFFVLISILLGCIIAGKFISGLSSWTPSGKIVTTERSVSAETCSNLEIEWAAGSVKIKVGDTDKIIVKESKDANNPHAIVTEFEDDTLEISYSKGISIHSGINLTGKDLTVIVPASWICKELTINGAALEIDISDLTVDSIDLDGAATELNFSGSLNELECDGAAAELNLNCANSPSKITIDGAACELELTLPNGCGYRVDADGLAIDFKSNCDYQKHDDAYIYGNSSCHIDVSGLGCKVTVNETK